MVNNDSKVLQELGKIIRDISADPVNEERKLLWKKLNGLEQTRPLIFIFEVPWHEMNYENELIPLCKEPFLRTIEISLRRTIYQWRNMQGDMVVKKEIDCPLAISNTGMGIKEDVDISKTDDYSDIVSRHFNIQIKSEEDLDKIKMPIVSHNEDESERRFQLVGDIFDGILPVRKTGFKWTSIAPWDELVRFMGLQEILIDIVMRPDYVHKVIERMTNFYLSALEQYRNFLSCISSNA